MEGRRSRPSTYKKKKCGEGNFSRYPPTKYLKTSCEVNHISSLPDLSQHSDTQRDIHKFCYFYEKDNIIRHVFLLITSTFIVSSNSGSFVSNLMEDFFFFTRRPLGLNINIFTYGSKL